MPCLSIRLRLQRHCVIIYQKSAVQTVAHIKGIHIVLKGILILLGFQVAGEFLAALFELPFPGAVIGMGLLFLFLLLRGGSPLILTTTSSALFPYIPLFLMPACVGAISYAGLLKDEWVAIAVSLTLSSALGFLAIPILMRCSSALFQSSNTADVAPQDKSND